MPKYKFTDIAFNSTEKKKPTEADKDTYIGLEHLDSGTLTVSRWGADIAPIGEKLVMKKGDILFGKRRAYQKKVGIAPFDGIFSAHGSDYYHFKVAVKDATGADCGSSDEVTDVFFASGEGKTGFCTIEFGKAATPNYDHIGVNVFGARGFLFLTDRKRWR